MIYAGLSDILYPGGTLGEFMYRVRAFAVRACDALHSIQITFRFIMLIDMSDSCHLRDRDIRLDENPSSDPMLLDLLKFILYAHLISHLIVVVVCTERNRVFFLSGILHPHYCHHRCYCCCCCCCCVVVIVIYYVNDFKRDVDVSVKLRVSKIHLCLALRTNLREL